MTRVPRRSMLEVVRTFTLAPGDPVPDLTGCGGIAVVAAPRTSSLDATYWDTADLRLATRGIRLRRRTGGTDAGWHVKLPAPHGTTEVSAPLGRAAAPPTDLRALLTSATRGARLTPVARIRTRRTELPLIGGDGRELAVVADDEVVGELMAGAPGAGNHRAEGVRTGQPSPDEPLCWREVEVGLVEGGSAVLDAVQECLFASGATVSEHSSKLGRILAPLLPAPPATRGGTAKARRSCAGDVLVAYLQEQVEAIVSLDPRVRRDEPGAVHDMRVATRRLRSALATYRPLLDRAVTEPLREELAAVGHALGGARDREVLRERLTADVAALPGELVLGPVSARIESTLAAELSTARRRAVAALGSPRHLALLDSLDALVAVPPLRPHARGPAADVMAPRVAHAYERLARALTAARRAGSHPAACPAGSQTAARSKVARDVALHDARKAAKRLRYAAEVLSPALPRPAGRVVKRAKALQSLLGDHQDSVVARAVLRELGVAAYEAQENAFTYGLLAGREQQRADEDEAAVEQVWARLRLPRALRRHA